MSMDVIADLEYDENSILHPKHFEVDLKPKYGLSQKIESLHKSTRDDIRGLKEMPVYRALCHVSKRDAVMATRTNYDYEFLTPLACFQPFFARECKANSREQRGVWADYGKPYEPLGRPILNLGRRAASSGRDSSLPPNSVMSFKSTPQNKKNEHLPETPLEPIQGEPSLADNGMRSPRSMLSIGAEKSILMSEPIDYNSFFYTRDQVISNMGGNKQAIERMKKERTFPLGQLKKKESAVNTMKCGHSIMTVLRPPDISWHEEFPMPALRLDNGQELGKKKVADDIVEIALQRKNRQLKKLHRKGEQAEGEKDGDMNDEDDDDDDDDDDDEVSYGTYYLNMTLPSEPTLGTMEHEKFIQRKKQGVLGILFTDKPCERQQLVEAERQSTADSEEKKDWRKSSKSDLPPLRESSFSKASKRRRARSSMANKSDMGIGTSAVTEDNKSFVLKSAGPSASAPILGAGARRSSMDSLQSTRTCRRFSGMSKDEMEKRSLKESLKKSMAAHRRKQSRVDVLEFNMNIDVAENTNVGDDPLQRLVQGGVTDAQRSQPCDLTKQAQEFQNIKEQLDSGMKMNEVFNPDLKRERFLDRIPVIDEETKEEEAWSMLSTQKNRSGVNKWRKDFLATQMLCRQRLNKRIKERQIMQVETFFKTRSVSSIESIISEEITNQGGGHRKMNFWKNTSKKLELDKDGTTLQQRIKFWKAFVKFIMNNLEEHNQSIAITAMTVKQYMEQGWAVNAQLLFILTKQLGDVFLEDKYIRQLLVFVRQYVGVTKEDYIRFLKRLGIVRDEVSALGSNMIDDLGLT